MGALITGLKTGWMAEPKGWWSMELNLVGVTGGKWYSPRVSTGAGSV